MPLHLFGRREGTIGEVETIAGKAGCVVSLSMEQCSECVCCLFHLIIYQPAGGRFHLCSYIIGEKGKAQRGGGGGRFKCFKFMGKGQSRGFLLKGTGWKSLRVPAAAAKSLQSCPTLCTPIDSSPPGSPVPGILQARTLEWCRGPAPEGSRGTLRMNGIGERETRRTSLDRAKSARERERKKERDQTRNMKQSLAVALFFTVAFIP